MRRLFLLLGVCLVMSLTLAPVANALQTQSQADIATGGPLPPEYVVEADGTVIDEGDVVTNCSSFLIGYQQGSQGRAQEEAQAVADKCQQLGLPFGDGIVGNSDVVLSLGTIGPSASSTGGEALPDTGGLSIAVLAGSLAFIVGGSMLKRSLHFR